MRLKLPRHVHGFVDRHGKPRHYLRRPGFKPVPLPGLPYSLEFMEAYDAAMAGHSIVRQIGSERTKLGTLNAAVIAYYNSEAFSQLSEGTRKARRNILDRFREEHGEKRISKLSTRPLTVILSKKKQFAARNWLKAFRGLCNFAVASGLMADNPTNDIELKAPKSAGFHSWDEQEISQFEERHPVGTRARLALALLLYTVQRRGDVVRLGRQHERDAGLTISITQQKTGTAVVIPIHPHLRVILDATPSKHLTYLVTEAGKPFSAAGFGNWFADRCREAKLPARCRAHGLRKAACRRLAEAGCTAPQISAISGHLSIREVQRYIDAANRTLLAREGMAKVATAFPSTVNIHSQTEATGLQNRSKRP
jgi:integrase